MKLTKDQRHTVYIIMLVEMDSSDFLCPAFDNTFTDDGEYDIHITYNNKRFKETLPELYAKKPNPTRTPNCWFLSDEEGNEARKNLLKQCIKETA